MNGRRGRIVAVALAVAAAAVPASAAGHRSAAPAIAFRWIQMLDRSRGYALSGENADSYRLLWTSDGGRRWSDVTPDGGKAHPSGPLSVFGHVRLFSTRLGQGVYAVERSDDDGRTWRRSLPFRDPHGQGAGQPFALDGRQLFLAVDEGAAAGSQAQSLFRSGDGGRSWHFVSGTSWDHPSPGSLPVGCDKSGFITPSTYSRSTGSIFAAIRSDRPTRSAIRTAWSGRFSEDNRPIKAKYWPAVDETRTDLADGHDRRSHANARMGTGCAENRGRDQRTFLEFGIHALQFR